MSAQLALANNNTSDENNNIIDEKNNNINIPTTENHEASKTITKPKEKKQKK